MIRVLRNVVLEGQSTASPSDAPFPTTSVFVVWLWLGKGEPECIATWSERPSRRKFRDFRLQDGAAMRAPPTPAAARSKLWLRPVFPDPT